MIQWPSIFLRKYNAENPALLLVLSLATKTALVKSLLKTILENEISLLNFI